MVSLLDWFEPAYCVDTELPARRIGRRRAAAPAITALTPAAATAFEAEALTAAQILYPLIGV